MNVFYSYQLSLKIVPFFSELSTERENKTEKPDEDICSTLIGSDLKPLLQDETETCPETSLQDSSTSLEDSLTGKDSMQTPSKETRSEFTVIRVPSCARAKPKLKRAGSGLSGSDYTKRRNKGGRKKLDKLIIKNVSRAAATAVEQTKESETSQSQAAEQTNQSQLICSLILQQLVDCCVKLEEQVAVQAVVNTAVVENEAVADVVSEKRKVPPLKIKSSQIKIKKHKSKKEDTPATEAVVAAAEKTSADTPKKVVPPFKLDLSKKIKSVSKSEETPAAKPEEEQPATLPGALKPASIGEEIKSGLKPEETPVTKLEEQPAVNSLTISVSMAKTSTKSADNAKNSKPGPKSRTKTQTEPVKMSAKRKLVEEMKSSKRPKVGPGKCSTVEQNDDSAISSTSGEMKTEPKVSKISLKVTLCGKNSKSVLNLSEKESPVKTKGRPKSKAIEESNKISPTLENTDKVTLSKLDKTVTPKIDKSSPVEKADRPDSATEPKARQIQTVQTAAHKPSPFKDIHSKIKATTAQPLVSAQKTLLLQNPPFFARKSVPRFVEEEPIPEPVKKVETPKPSTSTKTNGPQPVQTTKAVSSDTAKLVQTSSTTKPVIPDINEPVQTSSTTKPVTSDTTKPVQTNSNTKNKPEVKEPVAIKTAIAKIRQTPDTVKVYNMIDELFDNFMDKYKTDKTEKSEADQICSSIVFQVVNALSHTVDKIEKIKESEVPSEPASIQTGTVHPNVNTSEPISSHTEAKIKASKVSTEAVSVEPSAVHPDAIPSKAISTGKEEIKLTQNSDISLGHTEEEEIKMTVNKSEVSTETQNSDISSGLTEEEEIEMNVDDNEISKENQNSDISSGHTEEEEIKLTVDENEVSEENQNSNTNLVHTEEAFEQKSTPTEITEKANNVEPPTPVCLDSPNLDIATNHTDDETNVIDSEDTKKPKSVEKPSPIGESDNFDSATTMCDSVLSHTEVEADQINIEVPTVEKASTIAKPTVFPDAGKSESILSHTDVDAEQNTSNIKVSKADKSSTVCPDAKSSTECPDSPKKETIPIEVEITSQQISEQEATKSSSNLAPCSGSFVKFALGLNTSQHVNNLVGYGSSDSESETEDSTIEMSKLEKIFDESQDTEKVVGHQNISKCEDEVEQESISSVDKNLENSDVETDQDPKLEIESKPLREAETEKAKVVIEASIEKESNHGNEKMDAVDVDCEQEPDQLVKEKDSITESKILEPTQSTEPSALDIAKDSIESPETEKEPTESLEKVSIDPPIGSVTVESSEDKHIFVDEVTETVVEQAAIEDAGENKVEPDQGNGDFKTGEKAESTEVLVAKKSEVNVTNNSIETDTEESADFKDIKLPVECSPVQSEIGTEIIGNVEEIVPKMEVQVPVLDQFVPDLSVDDEIQSDFKSFESEARDQTDESPSQQQQKQQLQQQQQVQVAIPESPSQHQQQLQQHQQQQQQQVQVDKPKAKRTRSKSTSKDVNEPMPKIRRNTRLSTSKDSVDIVSTILGDIVSGVVFQSETLNVTSNVDVWETILATARPLPEMMPSAASPEMKLSSEVETDGEDDSSLFSGGRDSSLRNCIPFQVLWSLLQLSLWFEIHANPSIF